MKSHLKVATIVGSSTPTAWSQTYHAGGVTAVVSVRQKEGQESSSLSLVGKDLLNTFESEYFTLETKNLASIKEAVAVTYNKSKDTNDISLIVTTIIQNAVYVVLAGPGKILLIRKNNLATLLEQKIEDVLSASGFLESGDMMVLETLAFEEKVPSSLLLETMTQNSVSDTAEILSPAVHREQDGSMAALLLSYEDDGEAPLQHVANVAETPGAETMSESNPTTANGVEKEEAIVVAAPSHMQEKKHGHRFTHRQKIFLTIFVILAVVFVGAIYFSLQKKQTTQNNALFTQLFTPAQQKFQEGQGLEGLNASLAHDDFTQAKQMLEAAKGKFPAGSPEQKQIQALLDKVNGALGTINTPPQQNTQATKVDASVSPLLAFALKHPAAVYFAQDESNFYFADSTGITKSPKSGTTEKQIIQNGGDYKTLGGFDTYFGNMYILDTADGIDKYPVAASGYGSKTAYFPSTTPALSKAVSLAIDSSVWILTSDGTIMKYTKGVQDALNITGLTKPLNGPTKIVTTADDTNVYILDAGNSRIVVLKKDGSFVAEYVNPQLKSGTQMDVNETGKKVYVLSSGSVYEVDLK